MFHRSRNGAGAYRSTCGEETRGAAALLHRDHTRLSFPFSQLKNNKPTRVSAVLFNHRLAALSPSQRRKGVSWLVRNGVDVSQFKSARQVLAAQNALVSFVNNCSERTVVKRWRELDAATEEADPGVIVVQVCRPLRRLCVYPARLCVPRAPSSLPAARPRAGAQGGAHGAP